MADKNKSYLEDGKEIKYLDRYDIQKCGWSYLTGEFTKAFNSYIFEKKIALQGDIIIYKLQLLLKPKHYFNSENLLVEEAINPMDMSDYIYQTKFNGTIKNKEEFSELMKYLNIFSR